MNAIVGSIITLAIAAVAITAPWLPLPDPYAQALGQRLIEPVWMGGSAAHLLGTDHLGRDFLSRLIFGTRISLLIGVSTTIISGVIGVTLGLLAGLAGGGIDAAVSVLITARLALPAVLVMLAVVAVTGGSLLIVIAVLGGMLWDRYAVVTRSAVLQLRSREFILAARSIGCSPLRIAWRQVLPNIFPALAVVAALEAAQAIVTEAALSFLGLGVQPPLPSWGLMIAEGRADMFFEGWLIWIPASALFVLVLGITLLADGVRRD